jgi:hypothetical protein
MPEVAAAAEQVRAVRARAGQGEVAQVERKIQEIQASPALTDWVAAVVAGRLIFLPLVQLTTATAVPAS